jgi:hypothetical protein
MYNIEYNKSIDEEEYMLFRSKERRRLVQAFTREAESFDSGPSASESSL